MAKQLNVNLAFNADTSKAKAQIQELYQSLNNVGISTAKLPITEDIRQAQTAANQLKVAMNQAFNVETGKLDLLKFNQSIKSSGTSLIEIRNKLMQIGPTGQQAFLSLAQSIASAEIPARRTSALLTNLGTTLKNTVKWQFSSSMLHGFMGAVQQAYGYVQNLNKSLNDIRIVTGLSADEMDKFAIKANKAAKALSASTLEYTKASLIYYQQGLNEQQVKERTDVTVKMANATGATAEKVSQQMTAVWNNFDDGSKSLEYYADVMAALGAATASSTDEISQGLQKFASVANTVGLSYEYATAALATVTAQTRESADTVGTAFKTLFARIQGLSLGETLEDGVDLNKYSSALQSIGVNVLDANGNIREMDDILDDLGAKWQTLSDAQKQATAQTVAGVRQYTHLMALMENWDTFQTNLGTAANATGTLQEQAEIYAESWEGASKRVKAAWEAVYTDLLNDDFFITMTNALEKVLTLFDGFLDSIGGAKGLLFGLSSILLNTFNGAAAKGLENMVYNFKSFVGIAQKEAIATQNFSNFLATSMFQGTASQAATSSTDITAASAKTSVMNEEQALLQTIAQQREKMTEQQQQETQLIVEQTKLYGEQAIILAQRAEIMKQSHEANKLELMDIAAANGAENVQAAFEAIDDDITFAQTIDKQIQDVIDDFAQSKIAIEDYRKKLEGLEKTASKKGLATTADTIHGIASIEQGHFKEELENGNLRQRRHKASGSAKKEVKTKTRATFKKMGFDNEQADEYVKSQGKVVTATTQASDAVKKHQEAVKNAQNAIKDFSASTVPMSQNIVQIASSMASLSFAITQLSNLGNIWSDETLTGGQKLLQTLTSLTMAVPMVINGFSGLKSAIVNIGASYTPTISAAMKLSALNSEQLAQLKAEEVAEMTGLSVKKAKLALSNATIIAKSKELVASKANIAGMTAEQLAEATGMTLDQAGIVISKMKTGATLTEALAEAGLTSTLWAQIAAWIATWTAMSPVLVIVLALVTAIGILAGAIWLCVSAWKNWKANTPEGKLKAAKEEAKALAEGLEDAKQAAEDLKSSFDQYDSAVNKLAECTKGTAEWTAALHEVNGEVLSLMEKYPQLATMTNAAGESAIYKDSITGALQVADWAKEQLIEQSNQAILTAQAASIQGNQKVREAEINVKESDFIDQLADIGHQGAQTRYNNYLNQSYNEGLNSNTDPAQPGQKYLGGTNGAPPQEDDNSAQNQSSRQDAEKIAKYIADNAAQFQGQTKSEQIQSLKQFFADNNINNAAADAEMWVEAISDLNGPLTGLIEAVDANTAAKRIENEAIVSSVLAGQEDVQNSTYTQQIIEATAWEEDDSRYKAAVDAAKQTLIDEGFGTEGISQADGVNQAARDAFEKYAKAANITDYDLLDTTGNDNNRKFVYTVGDQEVTVSLDKMMDVIANQQAQEQMKIDAQATADKLKNYEISDEAQKALAEGMLTSGLGALTEDQKRAAQAAGGVESLLTEDTMSQMKGAFDALYGDEGPEKLEAWLSSLNDQLETWIPAGVNLDEVNKEFAEVQKLISDIKFGDVISAEDFGKLGEGAENYFTKMADGTYKMTGDAEAFYNYINAQNRNKLFKGIQDNQEHTAALQQQYEEASNAFKYSGITAENAGVKHNSFVRDAQGNINWGAGGSGAKMNSLSKAAVTGQLDLSVAMGTMTQEQADAYNALLEQGTITDADLQAIATAAETAAAAYGNLAEEIETSNQATLDSIQGAYMSARSLEDLNNIHVQMSSVFKDSTDSAYMYSQGLLGLAGQYANATKEAAAYQQVMSNALADGEITDDEQTSINEAESNLKASIMAGEAAKNHGLDADAIEFQAKQYQELYEEQKLSAEAATELAIRNQRMNKGVAELSKNFSTYKKALDKNNQGTQEYAEAAAELTDVIGDLIGAGEDFELPPSFFESADNMRLIEKAAQGDINAINALGVACMKAEVSAMQWNDAMAMTNETVKDADGNEISVSIDETAWKNAQQSITEGLDLLQSAVENGSAGMGTSLSEIMGDDTAASFIDGLNTMAMATNMSVDEMKAKLSEMGVSADVTTVTKDVNTKIPVYETTERITKEATDADPTITKTSETRIIDYKDVTQKMEVAQINMGDESKGTAPTFTGRGNVGSSNKGGGGGGGGGSKKKADTVKKKDVVQRYKPIDDKLDKQSNTVDKASRAMDRMYGKSRISAMEKYNELLQEEIDLMEIKLAEAQEYLKIDEADLHQALADATKELKMTGLEFEIDENGLISNYDEVMNALYDKLNAAITSANADGNATEKEQEEIDKIQEQIDAVTEAIEQYDETRGIVQDLENEIAEQALEIYDNELENLSYSIELNLELSDDSLALIEFQLSQIEDNAFKAAESIALMTQKAGTIEEKMSKTRDALAQLTAMTLDGEYTEEQMDLIKQYRDELMSLAQEYAELREQVHEQVMTTFEAWREEMDRGISTIEHSGSVLESYKNITDLLGKSLSDSVSSELYSQFSQSIINNSMDQIEAARAAYAGIQEAQARAQAAYEDAVARGDTASAEMWKETLNDLNEQANEAQEAMLSAWEDALNAAVEQFEASVERAVEAFKKPFDDMSEKFSRQKETSDIFLKDYQEIYELSKLSRDINKSIDDTESLGGKKKLKGLLEEINKLQEDGVEMSQYDLEYLQKTYDLRMAEIELENAQNAKNTVRLSKDNEGNWSYVYTTNTDAVDQAQQKYEDALYSMQDLSSNYIDEMSEKLISTSQEMADALAALRVEDFASYEEYQAEVARVTEEYEAQLAAQEAELNKAIGNNKELYDTDWKNYSDATGYKISETDKFVTAFRDSLLGSLMESTTQTSNFMEVLAGSAQVLVNSLGANGQEYFANIGAIMEAAGSSTEGFSTDATAAINAASEASQAASESVQTMAEDMVTAFDTVADSVEAWQERYSIAITEALEDTEALVTSINDLNESLVVGDGVTVPPITTTTTTGSNTNDNNTSTNTSTTNTNNTRNGGSNNKTESESLIEGNLLIVEFISQLLDANGDKSNIAILSESFSALLKEIEPEDFEDITKYQAAMEEINKQYIEAFNKITTAQDNKELYTGQWEALIEAIEANPQVLTDVIPEAMMPTISEIVEKISLNAQNMSLGIGSWAAQVIKDELIQTLQQDVSITAEFPNVVDHNEIEQALAELINTASQYANRKHYGES